MKEKILKDVGDTVVIPDIYDNSKTMSGIVSMITVTNKGIKYRATFDSTSKYGGGSQHDFWQDEIVL